MKIKEVKDSIKENENFLFDKQEKIKELELVKKEVIDARILIENDSEMDTDVKNKLRYLTNQALKENTKQAQVESKELDKTLKLLDDNKQKIELAQEETQKKIDKISGVDELLKKVHINVLEEGVKEAESSLKELDDVDQKIRDQIKEIFDISSKFTCM